MERVILIKYGELTTKKGNRNFFVRMLRQRIEKVLQDFSVQIKADMDRMYIYFLAEEEAAILAKIEKIFGIHTFHVAYVSSSDQMAIETLLMETVLKEQFKTFKVVVKRSDKNFPVTSDAFAAHLGGLVLKQKQQVKVDVHHPDVFIHVEVRKEKTYLYYKAYQGLGGYPVGTQPKALLMLSGGIDSPVAGYLAMKRGIPLEAVYFEALPHTSLEARNKVVTLCQKLAVYGGEINLHIVPFTKLQEAIYQNVKASYGITIMRRMMYRIMSILVKQRKAYAIINGESIGQVASQTLPSMKVINEVTNIPVIRPVACLDKLEIIDIAKKIATYETSILPYEDCCTVFVPKHPVIEPKEDKCLKEEAKFDYQSLLTETVEQVITMTINDQNQKKFEKFL